MPSYIFDPLDADQFLLQDDAVDYLRQQWPDWDPSDSHLEVWQIQALARMVAEAIAVASDVPPSIFKWFGQSILGLPPVPATFAEAGSTWEFSSNPAGRTIEAGTYVMIPNAEGDAQTFEVVTEVTVATPTLTTAIGEVTLRALQSGVDANDIGGEDVVVEGLDSPSWVSVITLTTSTSGGADEEDDTAYFDRLSARLTLLTPRPILPRDYELLAVDIAAQENIDIRALALDGYTVATAATYDPEDTGTWEERAIGLGLAMSDTGDDIDPDLAIEIDTSLQAMREINFIVATINPTRTGVDVSYTIVTLPDYVPADVKANVDVALADYLSAATWGIISTVDRSRWYLVDKVRRQAISDAIRSVSGVSHWTLLTVGIQRAVTAAAATDIVTRTAHGLVLNDPVYFSGLTGGAGLVAGTVYYARDITANTFKVAAAPGGAAVNITSDMTVGTLHALSAAEDFDLPGSIPLAEAGDIVGALA